jgi:membrane protease YdiL (CAAX protease family)
MSENVQPEGLNPEGPHPEGKRPQNEQPPEEILPAGQPASEQPPVEQMPTEQTQAIQPQVEQQLPVQAEVNQAELNQPDMNQQDSVSSPSPSVDTSPSAVTPLDVYMPYISGSGAAASNRDSRLWSPWASFGLGVAVFIANTIAQTIVMIIFGVILVVQENNIDRALDPEWLTQSLVTNGLMLSVAIIVSSILGLGAIILFISLRKRISFWEYLGARKIGIRAVLIIIGLVAAMLGITIGIDTLLGSKQSTNIIVDAYRGTSWPALFWIATVVFAPVFEEALFRGFLFVGLRQSILGPVWTIILTSVGFAALHGLQYDLSGVLVVLVLGLVLGVVRHKTNSIWGSVTLHALWNLAQMILLAVTL